MRKSFAWLLTLFLLIISMSLVACGDATPEEPEAGSGVSEEREEL